jgi:hypothetical protein
MANSLENNSESNLASLGQFGVRQLATGETSTTGEKFMAVYANEDSEFTSEQYSEGGDESITVKLKAGNALPGAFINITELTGDILCAKSEK